MTEATKARRRNSAASPVEKPKYEMPKSGSMQVPAVLHEIADKGILHTKDAFKNATAATEEAAHLFQHNYTAAARVVADYNLKAIEIALANAKSALDYAHELMGVKSPSEFVELSTAQARKQLEAIIAQTKELSALAQKVTTEIAAPLKTGDANALKSKKDKRQSPGGNDLSEISPEEEVLLLHVLE